MPIRETIEYLEYGKDNYWTDEKMVEQVARVAIPIFNYVFLDCEGFFAFDNASNHCAFTPDALVVWCRNLKTYTKTRIYNPPFSNHYPQHHNQDVDTKTSDIYR